MTIQIKNYNNSLAFVLWKTSIEKGSQPFIQTGFSKIVRHHPSVTYKIEWTFSSQHVKESKYEIQLDFLWGRRVKSLPKKSYGNTHSSESASSSDEEINRKEKVTVNPHQPHAIWVKVNKNTVKFKLAEIKRGRWKLAKSVLQLPQSQSELTPSLNSSNSLPLTLTIWIEFRTCTRGEKSVLKHLDSIFTHQKNCDIQFCFDENQKIGAHMNILAARSPVFAAMFEHDMQEAKTGQVNIRDAPPDIFKQLLHYIYSGRFSMPLTESTSKSLLILAEKYDIGDLKEECANFLAATIRVENAINLLLWAHQQSVDVMKEGVINFIKQNAKQVVKLDDWDMLITNYPELSVLVTRRIIENEI